MHLLESLREGLRPYYLRLVYFPLFGGRPDYFEACWRYPTESLAGNKADRSVGAAPAFLFLPMTDWHTRMQRSQHLATALAARGHVCYLLNPHLGRQFARTYLRDPAPRAGLLGERLTELHIRLRHEPVYHHRLLTAKETEALAMAMAPLAEAHGDEVTQILSFPTWGGVAEALRERHGWRIVYDCHDLLEGFHGIAAEIIEAEGKLLERADFVVFSSEYLREFEMQRRAIASERTALIRNAVSSRFFREIPHRNSGRKVAGYAGALDRWFDVEAVRLAAEQNPDALFRLAGRIEYDAVRALGALPNVELLGEIPHERLPDLLGEFDAGLIPFVVNELTRAANPIKLYEYFSVGLPVASARLPEVEQFGELAYFGDSASSFADTVRAALAEDDPGKRARRIRVAEAETWEDRAERLLRFLGVA